MQFLQSSDAVGGRQDRDSPRAGDLVKIRSQRWRVLDVRTYERCRLITVQGIGEMNAGAERRFLVPFDTVGAVNRPTSLRFVPPQRWRRACRALLAANTPPGGLRVARRARIDLLPHQLEPALALVRGMGSRVLLADEVGLGKTIEAGLIVAELRARGMADRILILTPAGLREQWANELSDRFDIGADIVDFRDVRQRLTNLPLGLNPWSTVPIAIASIDYVKRPEILHSVLSCRWDVLAIDEAHGFAGNSDRHAAVAALASRVPYVILLTATPHSGEPRAFHALCRIGAHDPSADLSAAALAKAEALAEADDPLLVFRRTRTDVGLGARRRVHRLHVRPSPAESDMHALLAELTRAVRLDHESEDVWLALSVFHKRALSSATSLAQSLDRRLGSIVPTGPSGFHQLFLPLADAGGDFDAADEPPGWIDGIALGDPALETRMLRALSEAAKGAAVRETKLAAIQRLVRRIAEPLLIFTEYRDTLLHLRERLDQPVSVLHGGLTREERTAALDDFTSGRRRILLATDAAGEGLNLHQRCRVVVNLELPWNPMRLEQRIGRVDRIGQQRTVHVFHLVARDTGEERIWDRLKSRIARARQEIAVADPIANNERETARLVMGPDGPEHSAEEQMEDRQADAFGSERVMVDLMREAVAEAQRLASARNISGNREGVVEAALEAGGAWVTRARLSQTRARLGSRIVALFRVEGADGRHGAIDSTLVPVAVALKDLRRRVRRSETSAVLRAIGADLQARADAAAARPRKAWETLGRGLLDTRLAREQRIAQPIVQVPPAPVQAGLFDRRAEYQHLAARAAFDEAASESGDRLARWNVAALGEARPARLLLVLTP